MRDHPDQHAEDPPTMPQGDLQALQRAALAELIKLSTVAVEPAEAQVERRYAQARQGIEKESAEAAERIAQRVHEREQSTRQEYENLVRQIEQVFTSDTTALEANTQTVRQRIASEAEGSARELKQTLDHQVWLAESVAEATRNQIAKDRKRLAREIPTRVASVEALQEQAEWSLHELGHEVPADLPEAQADASTDAQPLEVFEERIEQVQAGLEGLARLSLPRLFVGARPYLTLAGLSALAGLIAGALAWWYLPQWSLAPTVPAAAVGTAGVALVAGRALRRLARARVETLRAPLYQALADARVAVDRYSELVGQQLQAREDEADRKRRGELEAARGRFDPQMNALKQRRDGSLQKMEESHNWLRREIEDRREKGLELVKADHEKRVAESRQQQERELAAARQRAEQQLQECQTTHDAARRVLEDRWKQGLGCVQAMLDETARLDRRLLVDWDDPAWRDWTPPRAFTSVVRFGEWRVDLGQLSDSVRAIAPFDADQAGTLAIPTLLMFPDRCSLLLQAKRQGRDEAIRALRAVMARLLTSVPPGRVQFTIIDPVGLGENFAGFMHLADYDDALVGGRIWTDSAHIEQRLTDLTNHMENVIQKYLRNEFETIDAYNLQAGELAEPYRFLVVANFPANFNEEAARRLGSIVASGARCGVYTLVAHDTRLEMPPGVDVDDLKRNAIHLIYQDDRFVWQDDVLRQFPLVMDAPPAEEQLTGLMHKVGAGAKASKRVEVPFETIAPSLEQSWSRSAAEEIDAPIGRTGAVRRQHLRLGRGVAQHALIAGKTGSGKSTLLHVIITSLALWYRPDEVEFYLVDFKKGVEFKTYATHELPHARAVAIESDREFGLSVLHRLDVEMSRRGDLFRQVGVQDLPAYRQATGRKMPRTLLIVDEFQMFFTEDDKLAQDAAILLDRLVRQGRAFGIHVLLGSQTLGGSATLARSTIGQMAVRVALQCSDTDSQLILDDNNTAARLLSRPGEALYNDAGGLVEGNSPFQTAWLSEEHRDEYLTRVSHLAHQQAIACEPPIVFEGNAPADIAKNRVLTGLLESPDWPPPTSAPCAWLGEPVAIKEPTVVTLRRLSGANLVMVGQRDDAALGLTCATLLSLAAQHAPGSARFIVLDGSPPDAPTAGRLQRLAEHLPHEVRMVEWRQVPEVIAELTAEARRRQESDATDAPSIYLMIYGLHRYRMLRRGEDDFGFSSDGLDKPPNPDKQFAELLREGPPLGIHTIAWSDTAASLERTLDRQSLREFDNRVLFQMSAADSSNLIDSPAANRLGFHRALFFSEEQGLLEKFRPYALPEDHWLDHVGHQLARRADHHREA